MLSALDPLKATAKIKLPCKTAKTEHPYILEFKANQHYMRSSSVGKLQGDTLDFDVEMIPKSSANQSTVPAELEWELTTENGEPVDMNNKRSVKFQSSNSLASPLSSSFFNWLVDWLANELKTVRPINILLFGLRQAGELEVIRFGIDLCLGKSSFINGLLTSISDDHINLNSVCNETAREGFAPPLPFPQFLLLSQIRASYMAL